MVMQVTGSALDWLRETDTLTVKAIKRAVYEDLRCSRATPHEVRVANHSHLDPDEHTHTVDISGEIVSTCTCPQFEYRNQVCKHMIRVAMELERGRL